MAVHPSKLALGVVAITLLIVGGKVLDSVWSIGNGTVRSGEIVACATLSPTEFAEGTADGKWVGREKWEDGRLRAAAALLANAKNERHSLTSYLGSLRRSRYLRKAFATKLVKYNKDHEAGAAGDKATAAGELQKAEKDDEDYSDVLENAEDQFEKELEKIDDILEDIEDDAEKLIDSDPSLSNDDKEKAEDEMDLALGDAQRGITDRKLTYGVAVREITGVGIFSSFMQYEKNCVYNAVMSVRYLNFTGGLARYQGYLRARYARPAALTTETGLPAPESIAPAADTPGMLYYMLMGVEGVRWLIIENWVFAAIFLCWALILYAVFGGAIYRIAAIHFAREEKISAFQAMKFSRQKFFSLFSAPLVPVAVILVTGLLLAAGGLLGSIPFIGTFIMAALFIIAIALGIGIAFMLIGLVAGSPLLYPTIAVEGSDSFDAISRSFSYVFAQPFRAVLYGVVASIYGMITYLFVRLFAYLALVSAHCFVKWGLIGGGQPLSNNADKLDVLWQKPTFWNLQTCNFAAMDGWDKICAYILGFWVYIIVAVVAAYLLTFFASSSTAVYYILRRRVDATDLDDVYVEEEGEEAETVADVEPDETEPAEETKEEPPAEEPEEKED
jgi:ElaB/YqjD/DUF883 family membrane-anchored ribosome-binding protein